MPAIFALFALSQSVLIFTTARAFAVVYKRYFTATNFAAGFIDFFRNHHCDYTRYVTVTTPLRRPHH